MTPRASTYDLFRACNYLRLAYQAMSEDQDEARRVHAETSRMPLVERLRVYAGLAALKARALPQAPPPGGTVLP